MSEDTPFPSPAMEEVKQPGLKFLEAAVYGMGGLLVLMLIGLIAGIVWKASHKASPEAVSQTKLDIDVGPSASLSQMALDGDRLAFRLAGGEQDEIIIVDIKKGAVVSRIRLTKRAALPSAE